MFAGSGGSPLVFAAQRVRRILRALRASGDESPKIVGTGDRYRKMVPVRHRPISETISYTLYEISFFKFSTTELKSLYIYERYRFVIKMILSDYNGAPKILVAPINWDCGYYLRVSNIITNEEKPICRVIYRRTNVRESVKLFKVC